MTKQQADSTVFAPDLPLSSRCISLGERVHFKKKKVLFQMGTVPEKLYYLLSGTVRVVEFSEESERLVLFTILQDHFVCDVRFLAELPLSFQVESLTDITMIAFSRPTVVRLLGSDPDFRRCLFHGIAKKMRCFGSTLLMTAYDDNPSRLMHLLESSVIRRDGVPTITMSQQEIAEHLGVHRVTVNRMLRRLQAQGRLVVNRERITLL